MAGGRARRRSTGEQHELIAVPDQMLELVARDPYSGRELRLGVMASLRDLEVLGSAGMYYAETYVNAARPQSQVKRRRERAGRVGASLWNQAVDRCGIEEAG